MIFGIGLGVGFNHLAVRPDQHGNPCRLFLIRANRGAIGKGYRTVGVTQQIGRQTGFADPCFQIGRRTEGYAQQFGVPVLEFPGSITEPFGLFGSPAAKGTREKPDQYVPYPHSPRG